MSATTRCYSRAALSLALGVVMLTPHAASAQSGTSVLTLLDVADRRLSVGGDFTGALSSSDMMLSDDTFAEAWALDGRVGESVTIDMYSEDFDSYLYVVGPGLTETLRNDDGGGGCDARITFTFLESGLFRVVAASLSPGSTGTYTIRVSTTPGQMANYDCGDIDPTLLGDLPTDGRVLGMMDEQRGMLTPATATVLEGRPVQAWEFQATAGDAVTVTLVSDDFDAYLYIMGPGLDDILEDDDSAGELNSQITVTFPQTAVYRVVASALSEGSSGSYTLRTQRPLDVTSVPTDGRLILAGETMDGRLSVGDPILMDSRRGQVWETTGTAGQSVTIDLQSADFDSYLYVLGPGITTPLEDDDGGEGLNSQLTVRFPQDGSYRIVVSSLSEGSGAYTLRVRLGGM